MIYHFATNMVPDEGIVSPPPPKPGNPPPPPPPTPRETGE